MHQRPSSARAGQIALFAIAAVLLGYLILRALRPTAKLPGWWSGFGAPNSWQTIAIVTAVVALICVVSYRSRRNRRSATVPVAIVAGLIATGFVLGFASFWSCRNGDHPAFFTPLGWTASLIKGGIDDKSISSMPCPVPTPVALDVARLAILAAIFISVTGFATKAFRSQSDRVRVFLARSLTVVVGIDDDALSMITALGRTLGRKHTLVVITGSPDRACVQEARNQGACVVPFDLDRDESLAALQLWPKVNRLYLLSADASMNLSRLDTIGRRLGEIGAKQRLPLIVRFDDPWQAEAFRARHYGSNAKPETQWAADAVGKYEVTARRLLDAIIDTGTARHLVVAGTSPLTLALCAELSRRQAERDFHAPREEPDLPSLTLVAPNAGEYREDHELHMERRGLPTGRPRIGVVSDEPSVPLLCKVIGHGERHLVQQRAADTAVVFVDVVGSAVDTTTGTRLAGRFPDTPIYVCDPDARVGDDRPPVVGQLRTYRLAMDLPGGQAHDNWERAAMLTHERYASTTSRDTPSTVPWSELSHFYRESNRRQLRNALLMVEEQGGHTWNTWGVTGDATPLSTVYEAADPKEQIRLMGFTAEGAERMVEAEFLSWYEYYDAAHWRYGPVRDDEKRIHPRFVSWETTRDDEELLTTAYRSLATVLSQLRELGYRSRPT